MISDTGLEIHDRMFHLLNRIYPALVNFPNAEKFALAQDIKNSFFRYLSYVNRANEVKSKRLEYSQEAQGALQDVKVKIKLAFYRKYISKGFYKEISLELTEVSKMLAGYIRAINKHK